MFNFNSICCLLVFLSLSLRMKAQNPNVTICNTFESDISRITIEPGSHWEIGTPSKSIFNGSYSAPNSIVTDLDSPYSSNDSSAFVFRFPAPQYLGFFLPISIEFTHRFMMDSINDFGEVEMSFDEGLSWVNLLSDSLNTSDNINDLKGNFHVYEATNDTIFDSLAVTGSSLGWVHSNFYKSIAVNPDSVILVKFTFNSDSIGENEGWQIDDLCVSMDYLSSVPELKNSEKVKVSPNPNDGTFTIDESKFKEGQASIYDLTGKLVYREEFNHLQNKIISTDLISGIYILRLIGKRKSYEAKFVVD